MIRPAGLKLSRIASLALLAAALSGAGFLLAPSSSNTVVAAEGAGVVCRMIEVALDAGYSVSRTETREVCAAR